MKNCLKNNSDGHCSNFEQITKIKLIGLTESSVHVCMYVQYVNKDANYFLKTSLLRVSTK